MAFTPAEPSELRLYAGVPFDPRYEHSIYWGGNEIGKQDAYFDALPSRNFTDFRHIRKDSEILVNVPYDQLVTAGYNYCCTIGSHPYKRWYYFITGKRYVSQMVTALQVELDVIQTYQFDWEIPPCFVEREHPLNDLRGMNLLSEGLELGEFVVNEVKEVTEMDELAVVALSSVTMKNPMGEAVTGAKINNVYNGLRMFTRTANDLGVTVLNAALSSLSTQGKADGVQAMWMYPKALVYADWDSEEDEVMLDVLGTSYFNVEFEHTYSLDGYIPRNQKLLTHPYLYCYVHNNMGAAAVFPYEQFGTVNPGFVVTGTCSPDAVARLIPREYRGMEYDNESGLSITGFPSCSWTQDAYKIWMAQTAASQDVQMLGANLTVAAGGVQAGMGVVGLFTGNEHAGSNIGSGVNQMVSGYMQARSVLAAREDKQVQPPQAKGAQSGSVNVTQGFHHFRICSMSIRADQAARLDQFFDMYGYQTNEVKTPALHSRDLWNFVRTVGCVILGGIDANDRRKIGAIFDKGITLWHDPKTMYRYDLAEQNVGWRGE